MPKVSLEESETEKERDLELDDNLKKTTQKKNRQTGTLMTDISQMADLEKDHSIHTVPEPASIKRCRLFISTYNNVLIITVEII